MARIELKYKGDRAKIREELGFDMPVRAKRKPKPKTGIQDQTESKGDDSNDDNAAEAGHENANTSYPPSDVNKTSDNLPQMGVTPSDATVTATSDDVTAKATSNHNIERSTGTCIPSLDSNSGTRVPFFDCDPTLPSSGLESSKSPLSDAVNASDSVTASNITNKPIESSNIDKAPGNGAMNAAMFFQGQNSSNKDTIMNGNLASLAFIWVLQFNKIFDSLS